MQIKIFKKYAQNMGKICTKYAVPQEVCLLCIYMPWYAKKCKYEIHMQNMQKYAPPTLLRLLIMMRLASLRDRDVIGMRRDLGPAAWAGGLIHGGKGRVHWQARVTQSLTTWTWKSESEFCIWATRLSSRIGGTAAAIRGPSWIWVTSAQPDHDSDRLESSLDDDFIT